MPGQPDPGAGEIKIIAAIMRIVVIARTEGVQREEMPKRRISSPRFQAKNSSEVPPVNFRWWTWR